MNDRKSISPSQIVYNHIKEGRKIEAIKILCEETGISLKDAKEFIEKFELKNFSKQPSIEASESVLNHLRKGSKIGAIKKNRKETGMGLKDSKEAVEKIIDENPEVKKEMEEINKQQRKKAGIYILLIGLIIITLLYFL